MLDLPRARPYGDPIATASPLSARGKIFYQGTEPWRWAGVSAFPLLDQLERGIDITPFLQHFVDLGFRVFRVWPYVPSPPWIPGWEVLGVRPAVQLAERLQALGAYLELTLLTDDDRRYLPWAIDYVNALRDLAPPNVLIEIANEPRANGKQTDCAALRPTLGASPFLYASGLPPADAFGRYMTAHTGRDSQWPRRAHDLLEWYDGGGPDFPTDPPHHVPIVADEPIRPDQAGYDLRDFYTYAAACAILGAGATFHFEGGKTGQLPTPAEDACAAAFVEGLYRFPADAPLGAYRRIVEGPADNPAAQRSLRTYVVGSCMVRVRPTTLSAPEPGWTSLDGWGVAWRR